MYCRLPSLAFCTSKLNTCKSWPGLRVGGVPFARTTELAGATGAGIGSSLGGSEAGLDSSDFGSTFTASTASPARRKYFQALRPTSPSTARLATTLLAMLRAFLNFEPPDDASTGVIVAKAGADAEGGSSGLGAGGGGGADVPVGATSLVSTPQCGQVVVIPSACAGNSRCP